VQSPIAPLFDLEARIISLLGVVGDEQINLLVDLLLRLDEESAKEITLYISSQGGDMVQALKLVDTLRMLRSSVTGVGLGLIEGAGVMLLASCSRRIVFSNTLVSTAGLWTIPLSHPDVRKPMGWGGGIDFDQTLTEKLRRQVDRAFEEGSQKMSGLLGKPDQPPQVLDAAEAIAANLADSIITGAERRLLKPLKQIVHVKSIAI